MADSGSTGFRGPKKTGNAGEPWSGLPR